ncbi:hypothetical protein [Halobacteriovorax sp. ZH4_bin.1]|uniref:hypothetical protein n=1 Tax=unclassified Halobacteriovorax TaxID=2639665 RepID=UPI00371F2B53
MKNLRTLVDECVTKLCDEIVKADLTDELTYANWLAQTYFYTSSSEQILRFSAIKSKDKETSERWLEHADEETGHENLALSDLKKLGHDIKDYHEFEETRLFYQTQIYNAQLLGGESVFGWVLALEAFAANFPEDYLKNIINEHSKAASRFLIVHTNEDIEHIEKAFESVEKLDNLELIIENMELTTQRYINLLRKCSEAAKSNRIAA